MRGCRTRRRSPIVISTLAEPRRRGRAWHADFAWLYSGMKTAISLPDDLFKSGDALAKRLGVSRSELYARALADLVAKHRASQLTQRLNRLTGMGGEGVAQHMRSDKILQSDSGGRFPNGALQRIM